jgi:DNA repair protein RadC
MQYRSIKKWPEDERPRERLLKIGASELSSAQLLAIILTTGSRDKSAIELSRELLIHFSSLKEIEDASVAEFLNIKGIGIAKISQIKAALELGRRLFHSGKDTSIQKPVFKNSREVYEY